MTRYWLMKCEPGAYTIDDLKRDGRTSWEGVRNYQARNFMRDDMQVGDGVLFYASNADPSGVTGSGPNRRKDGTAEIAEMWHVSAPAVFRDGHRAAVVSVQSREASEMVVRLGGVEPLR